MRMINIRTSIKIHIKYRIVFTIDLPTTGWLWTEIKPTYVHIYVDTSVIWRKVKTREESVLNSDFLITVGGLLPKLYTKKRERKKKWYLRKGYTGSRLAIRIRTEEQEEEKKLFSRCYLNKVDYRASN